MSGGVLAGALLAAVTLTAAPTLADRVDDLPPVSEADLRAAVHDISLNVDDVELKVEDVEATRTEGRQTVVILKSDVLFDFGKATLPPAATRKVAELVAGVPRGGRLAIHGHTDSLGSDAANLALSRSRAQAVAAVVRSARPDLRLDVRGFGEKEPVEANTRGGKDNPEGRALNRRVELRFGG